MDKTNIEMLKHIINNIKEYFIYYFLNYKLKNFIY